MGMGKTIEILALILSNPSKIDPNYFIPKDFLFPSKATLVVCPSQICVQWQEEIIAHISKDLNLYVISTIREHKKLTFQKVMEADIIIVTSQFLKNKNYFRLGGYGSDSPKTYEIEVRYNIWIKEIRNILRETPDQGLSQNQPILELFHWKRIVFDEGHEYLYDRYYASLFNRQV